MTGLASTAGTGRAAGAARTSHAVRPRLRGREIGLLVLVAVALVAGSVSLGATQRFQAALLNGDHQLPLVLVPANAGLLAIYLAALAVAHAALVASGRRTDQVLLPTVGLLG